MNRQRSAAVVLRRWPYSETSLVVRALTPVQGVVTFFAKGCQRPTSGYMGVLDVWCLVEVDYSIPNEGELHPLYRAGLIQRFPGLSASPERLAAAAVVAELAEEAAPPGPAAGEVFLYLLHSLEQLNAGTPLLPFLCAAIMEGLGLLGLTPALGEDESGPPAPAAARRWFSAAHGGLLPTRGTRGTGNTRAVSPALLELLRTLRDEPDKGREASSEDLQAALTILEEFLLYHLERRPRAMEILHRRRAVLKANP